MRTLLLSVQCDGATTGNKDGSTTLAKRLLRSTVSNWVFTLFELLLTLGRLYNAIFSFVKE